MKGGRTMGFLKIIGTRGFYWGIGAAALGYILFPKAKQTVKPTLVSGVKGIYDIAGRTAEMYDRSKEKIAGMFKNTMEGSEIIKQEGVNSEIETLRKERENAINQVNELKNKIEILEKEIKALKG